MERGQGGSTGQTRSVLRNGSGLALILCLLAGCATPRPHLDEALLADRGKVGRNQGVTEQYPVACPDVLDVTVAGRRELSGRLAVGPDGCIPMGELGRLRVEGRTVPEVARAVASRTGAAEDDVTVRMAEFNSQQVYLFGEVTGLQRTVAYHGPETVLDLLQRAGGITPGAASGEVYVVRSHITDGMTPEVFPVDLQAIVRRHDERTNLRLQPFDQVYVGETRQSSVVRCSPRWLRPLFESCCGMRRPGKTG